MTVLWVVVDAAASAQRSGTAPDKPSAIRALCPTPDQYVTSLASYQAGQRERIRPVGPTTRTCSKCRERDAKPERSWCQRCENVKRWETEKAKRRKEQRAKVAKRPTLPGREGVRRQNIQRGIDFRAAKRQQRGEG